MEPDTHRVFLGIRLSPSVLLEVENAIKALRLSMHPPLWQIQWVKTENLHITLEFLGQVDHERVTRLKTELGSFFSKFSPIPIEIKGVDAFPDLHKPRVLWAGITEPSGQLSQMHSQLRVVLQQWIPLEEEREFQPHLTLGRVKTGRNLKPRLIHYHEKSLGLFEASEIILYESKTFKTGSVYSELIHFPLSQESLF